MSKKMFLFAIVATMGLGFLACNSTQKKQDEKKVSDG
jgi:hypothetical protein